LNERLPIVRLLVLTIAIVLGNSLSGCLVAHLRPPLRAAAVKHDAVALMDALERIIDRREATTQDREGAYAAVRQWTADTPGYALARAVLAGRVAQIRGVTAVTLVRQVEKWARLSMELDPGYRNGHARRVLGTLYVLAPASLVAHGDSEVGIELLEEQRSAHPTEPSNHLRLAEAFLALDDPEPAAAHLCFCIEKQAALRPSDRRLLKRLIDVAGGTAELDCG
jgi:hypothetical protein